MDDWVKQATDTQRLLFLSHMKPKVNVELFILTE